MQQPSIQNTYIKALLDASSRCFLKKASHPKYSSIAISIHDKIYASGNIESYNHVLDITSEHASLVLATQHGDPLIHKIITLIENTEEHQEINPLTIKILIDHFRRTGQDISYTIINQNNKVLWHTDSIANILSFYTPKIEILQHAQRDATECVGKLQTDNIPEELKKYATLGSTRGFTTYDSATGYGAAILTKKGNIYYAGQYSSFDHRMNIHAEMSAFIIALSCGDTEITDIGIVSQKHKQTPCNACGVCRQFYSEIIERTHQDITFHTFSLLNDTVQTFSMNEYLPGVWKSKIC
jgi:cytidine deaminase